MMTTTYILRFPWPLHLGDVNVKGCMVAMGAVFGNILQIL